MKIAVNGEQLEAGAATLAALLAELEYDPGLVATAVNEVFVRAKDRDFCALKEGDKVEVLSPRQGG
ncbi:sulfur carrier protein [Rhodoblastus acidophilus]|uniref:Sulfur carrier protein n=1 Tax=Rhodoblastus acidophilus TaxID=1074 RepID=A0A212RHY3_RHOAC|nr:sulfur carrier protein ThiS [Rhodoblastus acidophilus]MCW2317015.1 thiamine biosynthesis protein ThiS [Rhodoblastus acidophilus]PPQ38061.1 thiamine biosynthesis protein ThiS [Rhodoblastus acidophilus]RAI18424.1 thiamine biosynthesis protein ThiS [Rhodoblastus acidophilus]SNB72040.1 sulfur carrier protein [Rhodoblastus acidophilus]